MRSEPGFCGDNLKSILFGGDGARIGCTCQSFTAPQQTRGLKPALLAAGTGASTEEGMICVTTVFLEGVSASVRGVSGALQARFE